MRASVALVLLAQLAVAAPRTELWALASEGDSVHVFDVGSWHRTAVIEVGHSPHGISATADGKTVHITVGGSKGELIWIRARDYAVVHRLAVGAHPAELECTPDGRWIYVPCNDGHYWVVDGVERTVVGRIPTGGAGHNTAISPDGRFMYLSPLGEPHRITVVDIAAGHKPVGTIPLGNVPRPLAVTADGTRLFTQTDGLPGFLVTDPAARRVLTTVRHDLPADDGDYRCHGLAVRPDQAEVWSATVERGLVVVHGIEGGTYPRVATVPTGGWPYWVSFSPDSRWAFVSLRPPQTADKKVMTALIAAAVALVGWLATRRRELGVARRAVVVVLCGLIGGGATVAYYFDLMRGRIAVIDTQDREITHELRAGKVPMRTQVVVVRD